MAEEKTQYTRGKNPASLANLQRGRSFKDKEKAVQAQQKSVEIRRTRKSMREIAENIADEEQEFILADGKKVKKTKLEIIMMNFMRECAKTPTHKNVLALRQILGEDVQRLEVENVEGKYNDIQLTQEDIDAAYALLYKKHKGK